MSMFETTMESPGELHEWELSTESSGSMGEAFEAYETFESYETEQGEMHETMELELAQELLEITSEEELEEFLGKLVSSVGKAAKGFIKSPIGKALGGVLKNVAKTALPMVGSAIGSFVAPGIGTAIGGKLGSMAGKLLEAEELEMMGEAEAELEAARRYVSWARGTTRNAMGTPPGVSPRAAVRAAAVSSARRNAPGLLRQQRRGRTSQWRSRRYQDPWAGATYAEPSGADDDGWDGQREQSGRWTRRGTQIVLHDV